MTETIKSIQLETHGSPDVLQLVDIECPVPKPGEARVRLTAIGINMAETYQRNGLYPLALPGGIGSEGAGVVEALGEDIVGDIGGGESNIRVGDRVAFVMASGAYAEAITIDANLLVKIPDGISDEDAAAILLKGMTIDYLFNDTFPVKSGDRILFHAAAGALGIVACQWAKHLGVSLIGTAGTPEKCARAKMHGADDCFVLGAADIEDKLRTTTNGRGFGVVYDSVGKASYHLSLKLLAPFGTFVSFGNASGPIDAVSPADLTAHGSLYFTRPTLFTYLAQPGWMKNSAEKIFSMVLDGAIKAEINQRYALADAAQAHSDLEARKTVGSSLILPAS